MWGNPQIAASTSWLTRERLAAGDGRHGTDSVISSVWSQPWAFERLAVWSRAPSVCLDEADGKLLHDFKSHVFLTDIVSDRLGWDVSFGMKYRPLLTDNVIVGAGIGLFFPDKGYKDIYRSNTDSVRGFGGSHAGEADSVLWNALLTVTLTF